MSSRTLADAFPVAVCAATDHRQPVESLRQPDLLAKTNWPSLWVDCPAVAALSDVAVACAASSW